jgi:hypothetical protein
VESDLAVALDLAAAESDLADLLAEPLDFD